MDWDESDETRGPLSSVPELVHVLFSDAGEDDLAAQATFALLRSRSDVVPAQALPPLLDQLFGFLAFDEMDQEQRNRARRGRQVVLRLWQHCESLLVSRSSSAGRVAAILWSDRFHLLKDIAASPDAMDRVFAALADLPEVDGRALADDHDPLVRAALIIGHGPVCPSWSERALYDDPSAEVRAAAQDMYEVWQYDEPGTVDYRCRCPREPRESAMADGEETEAADAGDSLSDPLQKGEQVGGGAGILNFHQAMWLVEGDSPLTLDVDDPDESEEDRPNWGDQADFARLLPKAWHARRTDDWASFVPLVQPLVKLAPERRFAPENRALYNALNHLLLYAGDGQHPRGSLGELLSSDDDYELLGGFTVNFKRCWYPLLLDLWHWWNGWEFAPHAIAGAPRDWVDEDLGPLGDLPGTVPSGDPMSLSGHCLAPADVGPVTLPEVDAAFHPSIVEHEPTVLTLTVPTYKGWMAELRTMKVPGPSIVRVQISLSDPPDGVTLGFWLVQEFTQRDAPWRNHVRFLTDATAPAVMSLVREWAWSPMPRE